MATQRIVVNIESERNSFLVLQSRSERARQAAKKDKPKTTLLKKSMTWLWNMLNYILIGVLAIFALIFVLDFGTKLFSQWPQAAWNNEMTRMISDSIWLIVKTQDPTTITSTLSKRHGNPEPECEAKCLTQNIQGQTLQCIQQCPNVLPLSIQGTINENVSLIQTVVTCIWLIWTTCPIFNICCSTNMMWLIKLVYLLTLAIEACIAYSYQQVVCHTSGYKQAWELVMEYVGSCAVVCIGFTILQCYIVCLHRKKTNGMWTMFWGRLCVKFLVVVMIALSLLQHVYLVGGGGDSDSTESLAEGPSSSSSSLRPFMDSLVQFYNELQNWWQSSQTTK